MVFFVGIVWILMVKPWPQENSKKHAKRYIPGNSVGDLFGMVKT